VVFIRHSGLLNQENASAGEEINESKVPGIIVKALNSKKMCELLSGLIIGDTISLEHFSAIKARIQSDQNIDNRDVKRQQLAGIMASARESVPHNLALEIFFEHISKRSLAELNFFRDADFNNTLRVIANQVELIKAYQVALTVFRSHLEKLKTNATAYDTRKFHKQGVKLIQEIEKIVLGAPNGLDGAELSRLTQVLTYSSIAIDTPKDADNLKKLLQLSQTVSGKASPIWQGLGTTILIFTGLALVAAGILGALPTGGISLLLTVGGGVVLAGTGVGFIKRGTEYGVAKSLSLFKAKASHSQEHASSESDSEQEVVRPG
jgi:hypothetical protein